MISTSVTVAVAADIPMPQPIQFERETLDNGLRVIYAPMTNAPVIHVRVMYHVGSRDEAANRQGFAHMFEHMMFRGSAHVPPEQHMKLIQGVGGSSNAFTSFDQTTYVNTIPSNHLEMALWLEADRMASFKVSDEIFKTERNVVKEEWRLRYANQPYGKMTQDLLALAFTTHNYRWTPIGDMDQLAAAKTDELQAFHDRYYVPNNACLIIAGQYDVSQAKDWVRKYYGWMPKGADIQRVTKPEPEQTESREKIVTRPDVPFTRINMLYKSPEYRSDDNLALELLTTILGDGRSSRLYQAMVANDPVAANVNMGAYQLEDPSAVMVGIGVLPGKDSDDAIGRVKDQIKKVIAEGVSEEELAKAKSQTRNALVRTRMTAESVATILGDEEVFGGDATRANTYFDRLEKITVADVKTVAEKYLKDTTLSVVEYQRGEAKPEQAGASVALDAAVATSEPRKVEFPKDYPTAPPMNKDALKATFAKGEVQTLHGVQVITMTDNRLPVVNISLVLRGGGDASPAEKEGVASLTAAMLSRGAGGQTAAQLAEELESRGIAVNASDDGDTTRLSAFAMVDQLDFAVEKMKQIALHPDFPADEFTKLKRQSQQGLMSALSNPGSVADRNIDAAVWGEKHPLGKQMTLESLDAITLDEVKNWYAKTYRPENAILVLSGAVDTQKATELANQLLAGWQDGLPPQANYDAPTPEKRSIILVDNPTGEQAVVRLGSKAYTLKSEDRFPGSIAGQVLSSGIDSRLNKVLRAEKGLTYGAYGFFRPSRQGGAFEMSIETKLESVNDAITSAFGVLDKMKSENITDAELTESKNRVAGQMVLETQTIQQQAGRRVDTILNGYPVDYYDHYAERIAKVTADEVRAVVNKYLDNEKFDIVVVGPAETVKPQLESLGEVTVVEMPLKNMPAMAGMGRGRATTRPAQ
jgi:zinc protease